METADIVMIVIVSVCSLFGLSFFLYAIIAPIKAEKDEAKERKARQERLYKHRRGDQPIEIIDINGWRRITLPLTKTIKTDPPITPPPPLHGSSAVPPKIEVKIIIERAKDIDEKDSDEGN